MPQRQFSTPTYLLKAYGKVEAPSCVAGEVREIDVLFTPFPEQNANLESLGLLGKLATTPAIFEPYRNPASKEEICDCLLKLLEVRDCHSSITTDSRNPMVKTSRKRNSTKTSN